MDILDEFEVGMLVCLGIAGGLSSDVSIGDMCRTGEIVDLLDNAKVTDVSGDRRTANRGAKKTGRKGDSGQLIAFSPTHYGTPIDISVALDLDKLLPDQRESYEKWAAHCGAFALTHLPTPFTGKDGKEEVAGKPVVR